MPGLQFGRDAHDPEDLPDSLASAANGVRTGAFGFYFHQNHKQMQGEPTLVGKNQLFVAPVTGIVLLESPH